MKFQYISIVLGNTSLSNAEIKFVYNYVYLIIAGKREKNNNIKTMGRKFGSGEFEVKINLHDKENIDDEESIKINQLGNGFYLLKIKKTNKE